MNANPASDSRNDLILANIDRVHFLARRIFLRIGGKISYEDLCQYGFLGLLKAADSFDSERGFAFGSLASIRIEGAIIDGLRSETKYKSYGDSIKLRSIEEMVSEDRSGPAENHPAFLDSRPSVEEELEADNQEEMRRSRVWSAIAELPPQQVNVMMALFGDEMTESATGKLLGLHESRISQLKRAALCTLRTRLSKKSL